MPITISDIRDIHPAFASVSDIVLSSVLESVILTLEKILNRKLQYALELEWHPIENHSRIYLRRIPVIKIEYVDMVYFGPERSHEGCNPKNTPYKRSNQAGHVWTNRKYVLTPESGTVSVSDHPCHIHKNGRAWYAVKYTGGFDPIPADLLLAIAIMTQYRLATIQGPTVNPLAARERIGDYEIEYRSGSQQVSTSSGLSARIGPGGDQVAALIYPYMRSGVNGI